MANGFRAPGVIGGGQIIQPGRVQFGLADAVARVKDRQLKKYGYDETARMEQARLDQATQSDRDLLYNQYLEKRWDKNDKPLTRDAWEAMQSLSNQPAQYTTQSPTPGLLGMTQRLIPGGETGMQRTNIDTGQIEPVINANTNIQSQPISNVNDNTISNVSNVVPKTNTTTNNITPTNNTSNATSTDPLSGTAFASTHSNIQKGLQTTGNGSLGDTLLRMAKLDIEDMNSDDKNNYLKQMMSYRDNLPEGSNDRRHISSVIRNVAREIKGNKQSGGPIMAHGGHLPGNRTGDLNPAKLEDGEYVLNRNAVKAIGKDWLDWVNNQEHPRFENSKGYQMGGFQDPQVGAGSAQIVKPKTLNFSGYDKLGKGISSTGEEEEEKQQGGFISYMQEGGSSDDKYLDYMPESSREGARQRDVARESDIYSMDARAKLDQFEFDMRDLETDRRKQQEDQENSWAGYGLWLADKFTPDFIEQAGMGLLRFTGADVPEADSWYGTLKASADEDISKKFQEDSDAKLKELLGYDRTSNVRISPELRAEIKARLGNVAISPTRYMSTPELIEQYKKNVYSPSGQTLPMGYGQNEYVPFNYDWMDQFEE